MWGAGYVSLELGLGPSQIMVKQDIFKISVLDDYSQGNRNLVHRSQVASRSLNIFLSFYLPKIVN